MSNRVWLKGRFSGTETQCAGGSARPGTTLTGDKIGGPARKVGSQPGFGFPLQTFAFRKDHFLVVHLDQPGGLEAVRVAGNNLAPGAQIQGDFLVAGQVE